MPTALLVTLWIGLSILEDLALAKLGIYYLRRCIPIYRVDMSRLFAAITERSQWLIPITHVKLNSDNYLLRETYKIRLSVSYPILCYGHLVLAGHKSRVYVRLKWTSTALPFFFIHFFAELQIAALLAFLVVSAITIQCVRFRNESRRLLPAHSSELFVRP